MKGPPKSDLLAAVEDGARGLLVTLVSLFNLDGGDSLSHEHFCLGAEALGYDSSEIAWKQVCSRLGVVNVPSPTREPPREVSPTRGGSSPKTKASPPTMHAELDLALTGEYFGNKYDHLLQGVLQQQLRGMMSLAARVSTLEETVDGLTGRAGRERERKLQGMMMRWKHGLLVIALDSWKQVAQGQRDLRRRALGHLQHGTMAKMWRRWREMVAEACAQRAMAAKVAGRIRNRLAAQAFASWVELYNEAKERWAAAGRALARMMNREMSQGFESWRQFAERARRTRQMLAQVAGRMRHRLATMAFLGWSAMVNEAKRQRQLVARAIGRMLSRQAAVALGAWHEAVVDIVHSRNETLRHAVNLLANRVLSLSFDCWVEQVQKKKTVLENCRRLAGRLLHALTGKCFDAWLEYIAEQRRVFWRAAYAIGPGRLLSLAYRTWADKVREAVAARDRDGERGWMMESIDARMAVALDHHLGARVMIVKRVLDTVATLENKLQDIEGLPERLEASVAEMAERAAMDEERRRQEEEARLQKERENRALRALRRLMQRHVCIAFDTWVAVLKEAKAALNRAARAWLNASTGRAWRVWAEAAREWARLRQVARQIIGRMRNQLLSLVFCAWANEAYYTRQLTTEARLEAERAASREAFLTKLREVGVTWLEEMMQGAEAKVIPEPDDFGELPLGTLDDAIDCARSADVAASEPTLLEMLDERYIRMDGSGTMMRVVEIDANIHRLQKHVLRHIAGLNEQCAFLRSMLCSSVSSDAPIDKATLRPLRSPPRLSLEGLDSDEILRSFDPPSRFSQKLQKSRSAAAVLKDGPLTPLKPLRKRWE